MPHMKRKSEKVGMRRVDRVTTGTRAMIGTREDRAGERQRREERTYRRRRSDFHFVHPSPASGFPATRKGRALGLRYEKHGGYAESTYDVSSRRLEISRDAVVVEHHDDVPRQVLILACAPTFR